MIVRFGPFTLTRETRQLRRDEREIHLSPKAFELLLALADARPAVVSKADLQQRLWPETFVAEANLSNLVAEIREALGDRAHDPLFIRTAHGFGYAFCATTSSGSPERGAAPSCWLDWERRRFPLSPGEHIIGRDPDADIRIEGATVSRHHARLIVATDGATIQDCASKNGTYREGERIASPVRLVDGDAIRIGSVLVTFHVLDASEATLTQTTGAP